MADKYVLSFPGGYYVNENRRSMDINDAYQMTYKEANELGKVIGGNIERNRKKESDKNNRIPKRVKYFDYGN